MNRPRGWHITLGAIALLAILWAAVAGGSDRKGSAIRPAGPSPSAGIRLGEPSPAPSLAQSAQELLARLRVAAEAPRAGYERGLFGSWIDADGDGCDTRHEVLNAESLVRAHVGPGCSVSGQWFSAYDGVTTTDASALPAASQSTPRRADLVVLGVGDEWARNKESLGGLREAVAARTLAPILLVRRHGRTSLLRRPREWIAEGEAKAPSGGAQRD